VSAASYNLVIGEAYYFLAAGRQTQNNAKYKLSKPQFLKTCTIYEIACASLHFDEKNINLGI